MEVQILTRELDIAGTLPAFRPNRLSQRQQPGCKGWTQRLLDPAVEGRRRSRQKNRNCSGRSWNDTMAMMKLKIQQILMELWFEGEGIWLHTAVILVQTRHMPKDRRLAVNWQQFDSLEIQFRWQIEGGCLVLNWIYESKSNKYIWAARHWVRGCLPSLVPDVIELPV